MTGDSHVYAVVEDGTVTNVIVATADFAASIPGTVRIDHLAPRPGLGWTFAHRRWTAPADDAVHPAGYHPFPT